MYMFQKHYRAALGLERNLSIFMSCRTLLGLERNLRYFMSYTTLPLLP